MSEPRPAGQETHLGIVIGHAWLLSTAYLLCGVFVAAARNWSSHPMLLRATIALDAIARTVLELCGLWQPVVRKVLMGDWAAWQARLVIIGVTVGFIFGQSLVLGAVLWAVRKVARSRGATP